MCAAASSPTKRKIGEAFPSETVPEGAAKKEKIEDEKTQAASSKFFSVAGSHFHKPSAPFALAPKSRPSTQNLTFKLTLGIERTYTCISIRPYPPKVVEREKYKPLAYIHRGGKNVVYKGKDKEGNIVAIKYNIPCPLPHAIKIQNSATPGQDDPTRRAKFDPRRFEQDKMLFIYALKEVECHKAAIGVRHAIRPIACFESAPYERALVMEYVPEDLVSFCNQREIGCMFKEVAIVGRQILEFLIDISKRQMIYPDLKLNNIGIFPDTLRIRVLDFDGYSPVSKKIDLKLLCTFNYQAPELLIDKDYDQPVVIWSFGMLLYSLFAKSLLLKRKDQFQVRRLTPAIINDALHTLVSLIGSPHESFPNGSKNGHLFFKAKSGKCELFNAPTAGANVYAPDFLETNIRTLADKKKEPKELADAFISLLQSCLQWDPALRPSAEKLYSHPFFAMAMKAQADSAATMAALPKDPKDEKEQ